MNNFPYPYPIIPPQNPYSNQNELLALKEKIKELEKRIISLENQKQENYLKKDDNYQMI